MNAWKLMTAALLAVGTTAFAAEPVPATQPPPGKQVLVEVLVFKVRDKTYREMKLDEMTKVGSVIDPKKCQDIVVKLREAGMADIVSRPQLLLTDNQEGYFCVGRQADMTQRVAPGTAEAPKPQTAAIGIEMHCTPRIAPDCQSTLLRVKYSESRKGSEALLNNVLQPSIDTQAIETTCKVPAGQSMLFCGGIAKCEGKIEHKVPVLGDQPIIGSLFHAVETTKDYEHTLVWLKPTVDPKPEDYPTPAKCGVRPPDIAAIHAVPRPMPVAPAMMPMTAPIPVIANPVSERQVRVATQILRVRSKGYEDLKLGELFGDTDVRTLETNEMIEALRTAKSGVEILDAPRLTTFDGQNAKLAIGIEDCSFVTGVEVVSDGKGGVVMVPKKENHRTGLEFQCTPRVSADGRFILLDVGFKEKSVQRHVPLFPVTSLITPEFEGGSKGVPTPFTQFIQQPVFQTMKCDKTLGVPVGKTVLVKIGSRECESRTEFGPPVLSRVPYVNRLFKNVGVCKDTEYTILVLTTEFTEPMPQPPCAKPIPTALMPVPCSPPLPMSNPVAPACLRLAAQPCPMDMGTVESTPGKHAGILKILMEQYHVACKAGDTAKARTIAAHCLELDPTCFAK